MISNVISFVEIDCLCSAHRLTINDLWLLFQRCADLQLSSSLARPLWQLMLEQQQQARAEWTEALTLPPLAPPGTVDHEADSWRARPSQLLVPARLTALVLQCLAQDGTARAGAEAAAHELFVNILPRGSPAPPLATLPPLPPSRWSALAEARAADVEAEQCCFEIDAEVFSPVALRYAAAAAANAGDDLGLEGFFAAVPASLRSGTVFLAMVQRRVAAARWDDAACIVDEMQAALGEGATLDQTTLAGVLEVLSAAPPAAAPAPQLAQALWSCAVRLRSLSVAATSAMLRVLVSAGQQGQAARVLAEACGTEPAPEHERAVLFADASCFALALRELAAGGSQSEALQSTALLLRQRHGAARARLEARPSDRGAVEAERVLRPLPETVTMLQQCGLPLDQYVLPAAPSAASPVPASATLSTSDASRLQSGTATSESAVASAAPLSPAEPARSAAAASEVPPSPPTSVATDAAQSRSSAPRSLLSHLRVLRRLKSITPAEIEACVAGFADSAWDPKALTVYLECYGRVGGAPAALRVFDLVTGALGFAPTRSSYLLLLACVLRDWRPGQSEALVDAIRARMLSMAPPQRLKGQDVDNVLRSRCRAPPALVRLHSWALEDEAWARASPRSQRVILEVVATARAAEAAAAAATAVSSPTRPRAAAPSRPAELRTPPTKPELATMQHVQSRMQSAVMTPAQRMAKIDVLFGTGAADIRVAPAHAPATATATAPSLASVLAAAEKKKELEETGAEDAPHLAARAPSVESARASVPGGRGAPGAKLKPRKARAARQRGGSAYLARFDAELFASRTGAHELVSAAKESAARRGVKAEAGAPLLTPTPLLFAQLFRGMAFAFQDDGGDGSTLGRLDSLRGEMVAYDGDSAPLRFGPRHVSIMLPPFCARPLLAKRLLRWAREDGAFAGLSTEKQRRIVAATGEVEALLPLEGSGAASASASADTASATGDSASVSSFPVDDAASVRLQQELRQLRNTPGMTASDVSALATAHGHEAWTLLALHECLTCFLRAPQAVMALQVFERVTAMGVVPTAATFTLLLRCMAADWRPAHLAAMDSLRARMRSARPPVRLDKPGVQKLHQALLAHPTALLRVWLWAGQDGVMTPQLQSSVDAAMAAVVLEPLGHAAEAADAATGPAAPATDWAGIISQQSDVSALSRVYLVLAGLHRAAEADRILQAHESLHGHLGFGVLEEWLRLCRECMPREFAWAAAAPLWRRIEAQHLAQRAQRQPSNSTLCDIIEICLRDGTQERLRWMDELVRDVEVSNIVAGAEPSPDLPDLSRVALSRRDWTRLIDCARACHQHDRARRWSTRISMGSIQTRTKEIVLQLSALGQENTAAATASRSWQRGPLGQFTVQNRMVQSKAEALLRALARLLAAGGRPEWGEWSAAFQAMLHHNLCDFAMPMYFALMQAQERMIRVRVKRPHHMDAENNNATAAAATAAPAEVPKMLRVPSSCCQLLLQCVVHSSASAAAAASSAAEAEASMAELDSQGEGASPAHHVLPPEGLGGVELALWLLQQMEASESPLASRFVPPEHGADLLREMELRVRRDRASATPRVLALMRGYYDSIPHRTVSLTVAMHAAYVHAGMVEQAAALQDELRKQNSGEALMLARLASIRQQLERVAPVQHAQDPDLHMPSTQEADLLDQVQSLWREAQADPQHKMGPVLVGAVLRLYHLRSVSAQLALLDEALQLETRAAEQSEKGPPVNVPVFTRRAAPVFVNASAFAQLFDSLAHNPQAYQYTTFVDAAYAHMCERHEAAVSLLQRARARQLEVTVVARNTYLKFLQRTRQTDQVMAVWAAMSRADKEGNAAGALVVLNALASSGGRQDHVERVVAQFGDYRIPLSVELCTAWLSCYRLSGDWRAAELLWRRMPTEMAVRPDARAYTALMAVYMGSREPDQLAKIEPLCAEMSNGSGPAGKILTLSSQDCLRLVKCARRSKLTRDADLWLERSREAANRRGTGSASRAAFNDVNDEEEES